MACLLVGLASTVAVSCSSGGGEAVQTTEEEKRQPQLLPPTDVDARAKKLDAALTWAADPEGLEADRFIVFRNGVKLVDLGGTTSSFVDREAVPGKRYTYMVKSELDGKRSEGASVMLKIKRPPLASARLDGLFDIRSTLQSSSGFSSVPDTASYGWRFSPRCRSGPCRVVWSDYQGDGARARLDRRGASYSGTYTGQFGIRCGSAVTTSFVEIVVRVMRARKQNGEWLATRVRGTLETSDSSQLGCVSSHKTEALTGRLVN